MQLPIVSGNWCDLHDLVTRYGMKMLAGHPESSSDGSERTHTLSNELEECQTKLTVVTAELENLKKSKKAPDGKHNSVRKIRSCADKDF